jgi:hypothetical protein
MLTGMVLFITVLPEGFPSLLVPIALAFAGNALMFGGANLRWRLKSPSWLVGAPRQGDGGAGVESGLRYPIGLGISVFAKSHFARVRLSSDAVYVGPAFPVLVPWIPTIRMPWARIERVAITDGFWDQGGLRFHLADDVPAVQIFLTRGNREHVLETLREHAIAIE